MNKHVSTASRPAWLPKEERQHERRLTDITIVVDEPSRTIPATLLDLSSAGCRLSVSERLSLGTFLKVQLSPTIEARGWVAWSRGLEAGIDFTGLLPQILIEELAGVVQQVATPEPKA